MIGYVLLGTLVSIIAYLSVMIVELVVLWDFLSFTKKGNQFSSSLRQDFRIIYLTWRLPSHFSQELPKWFVLSRFWLWITLIGSLILFNTCVLAQIAYAIANS